MALSLKGGLIRCGRCGRRYSNPLSHVCAGRSTGRTKIAPKASVAATCSKCGRTYSNPVTHVCSVKSDFKKRKAADTKAKKAAARKARPEHRPSACRDADCRRAVCESYREGYANGLADGLASAERS